MHLKEVLCKIIFNVMVYTKCGSSNITIKDLDIISLGMETVKGMLEVGY